MNPQFVLDVYDELLVDNFAGGGGASTGIFMALGRCVNEAVNHNEEALGMHRINHPQTVHHQEDVFAIDPIKVTRGRRVGAGWFSPDCRHFSKAKGGKPLSKKIRGLAFVMFRWAAIRTRVMYMENVEEIQTWGPLLHNPKHPKDCECGEPCGRPDPKHIGRTWKAFLSVLTTGINPDHPDIPDMLERLNHTITKEQIVKGFGYKVEFRELRACDYGAPTIRKRLFMVARCDGKPIVWPQPTHAAPDDAKAKGLKPWRTIAECIDWDVPCHSIFLSNEEAKELWKRKRIRVNRPLAEATLKRIAAGIDRYVLKSSKPFIVSLTHQGGDRNESLDEPAKTLTAAHRGEKGLVQPKVAPFVTDSVNGFGGNKKSFRVDEPGRTQCAEVKGGHFQLVSGALVGCGGRASQSRPRGLDEPTGTGTTKADAVIAATNLVKLRGDPETHSKGVAMDEPGHVASAGGQHHALSACYMAQHNTGAIGHPATDPASTIVGRGTQQQLTCATTAAYFGTEKEGDPVDAPMRTASTKPRFCVVESEGVTPSLTPDQIAGARRVAKFLRDHGVEFEGEFATVGNYVIVDIGMRMLTARELYRAQGFPEGYVIDRAWLIDKKTGELREVALTKEEQIRMCGNSVCPPLAEAVVKANSSDMAVWNRKEWKKFRKTLRRKMISC
jgi:DNA (cytosine-5)-methyltransferase 1